MRPTYSKANSLNNMLMTGHLDDVGDFAGSRETFLSNDHSSRKWNFSYPKIQEIMEGIIHIVKAIPEQVLHAPSFRT